MDLLIASQKYEDLRFFSLNNFVVPSEKVYRLKKKYTATAPVVTNMSCDYIYKDFFVFILLIIVMWLSL